MPQCQFLFSAVFGFRKVVLEIFSELDEPKAKVPILLSRTRSPEGSQSGVGEQPHHRAARPPWPRHQVVWPPQGSTDTALPPIYSFPRENPKYFEPLSTKSSATAVIVNPSSGGF